MLKHQNGQDDEIQSLKSGGDNILKNIGNTYNDSFSCSRIHETAKEKKVDINFKLNASPFQPKHQPVSSQRDPES